MDLLGRYLSYATVAVALLLVVLVTFADLDVMDGIQWGGLVLAIDQALRAKTTAGTAKVAAARALRRTNTYRFVTLVYQLEFMHARIANSLRGSDEDTLYHTLADWLIKLDEIQGTMKANNLLILDSRGKFHASRFACVERRSILENRRATAGNAGPAEEPSSNVLMVNEELLSLLRQKSVDLQQTSEDY